MSAKKEEELKEKIVTLALQWHRTECECMDVDANDTKVCALDACEDMLAVATAEYDEYLVQKEELAKLPS